MNTTTLSANHSPHSTPNISLDSLSTHSSNSSTGGGGHGGIANSVDHTPNSLPLTSSKDEVEVNGEVVILVATSGENSEREPLDEKEVNLLGFSREPNLVWVGGGFLVQ